MLLWVTGRRFHISLVLVDVVTVLQVEKKSVQETLTKQEFLFMWNLYSTDFENVF